MSSRKTIHAKFNLRVLFGIISIGLLLVIIYVLLCEKRSLLEWRQYQATYNDRYAAVLAENINAAKTSGDKKALEKWTKLKNDQQRLKEIKMRAIFLPGARVRDLCTTCHIGMNNPLFNDAENPLKTHPQKILRHHKIGRFGCTLCHHGQGVGLTVETAHGNEENWDTPRIPMQYIESSCFGCHETVFGLDGAKNAAEGKRLFVEMGCYGCHDANIQEGLPKFSTPFSGIAKKITNPKWAASWIKTPQAVRPGTLMPEFRLKPQEISDIVAYIYGLTDKDLKLSPVEKDGSAGSGKQIFTNKGCIACHSPERDKQGLTRRIPNLSDAGLKLNSAWVYKWIGNPQSVNPDTWMPKLELTPDDVTNLTAYVATLRDKAVKELLATDMTPGNSDDGKALVQRLGCLGCHHIKGQNDPSKVGVSVSDVADKRMDELPFGNSDVPHTKWDWIRNKIRKPDIYQTTDMPMYMPDYVMTDAQRKDLTIFYLYNRLLDLPETYIVRASKQDRINERGAWMVQHFNCKGCHEILADEKSRIRNYIAKQSMVPPRIVNEAEKVQPTWLFNYLKRPSAMRPWLEIRMPAFNIPYNDITLLIQYLYNIMPDETRKICKIPYEPGLVKSDYDPETIEMGKYRFRYDKCMQCHPVSFTGKLPEGKNLEDLSINLMLAKSRLRFRWIKDFLRDPDKYAGEGTKMPFVFYTPDNVPRIPDPEAWIQRTALFLMFMEKVPEPVKTGEKTREVQEFDFSNY